MTQINFFRLIEDAALCVAIIVILCKTILYVISEINIAVLISNFTEIGLDIFFLIFSS